MAKLRHDGEWHKNAAGVYVQAEPVGTSIMSGATTGDVLCVASDDTVEAKTITAGTDITITHGAGTITIASTASGGGGGGGILTPDTPPASADAMDDEFATGSAIDTGLWTGFNTTNLTNSVNDGALVLEVSAVSGNIRGYLQTLPVASSWRFRTKVTAEGSFSGNSGLTGLVLRESGTGKLLVFLTGASGGNALLTQRWNSVTSWGATLASIGTARGTEGIPYYLDIELSGSNYLCRYSYSGARFRAHSTVALTTPFTTAADEIGVFIYNDNGGNDIAGVFEFFRRIA